MAGYDDYAASEGQCPWLMVAYFFMALFVKLVTLYHRRNGTFTLCTFIRYMR